MNREELLNDLKAVPELDPDQHDGSYELMREIVASYKTLGDYSSCNYRDLNAVYMMAVGTWRLNPEKKKEYIKQGHLSDGEKARMEHVIDKIWDNACRNMYKNREQNKPSIGMFGTGFYSFQGKTTDECTQAFLKMLVDIAEMDSDDDMFDRAEQVLTEKFKGMQAASASVILHCLKPMSFPILNGNMGKGNIFELLGVELKKPAELGSYIENCRQIKEYRNQNLTFKNYRILDLWTAKIDQYQDDEYFPSLKDYDPGLSREQYSSYLQDENMIKRSSLDTLYYIYKTGGEASCAQIAAQYGDSPQHYNANAITVGRKIAEASGCPLRDSDGGSEDRYWPVLFQGRYTKKGEIGTFIWHMRKPLFDAVALMDDDGFFNSFNMKAKTTIEFDLNMILCGPPGTGKTYNTVLYAVAVVEKKTLESVKNEAAGNYSAVKKRFDEYLEAGRVAFTTFHQSYGYEEFIEGIRPNVDDESENISYSIESGVFKAFCDAASDEVNMKDIFDTAWTELLNKANQDGVEYTFQRQTGKTLIAKVDMELEKFYIPRPNSQNDITRSGTYRFWSADALELERLKGKNNGTAWRYAVYWAVVDELKKHFNLPEYHSDDESKGNYVFIIDEINRGNISKIFGELITLLESTKRKGCKEEASAILPYSGERFSIPKNVYVIGTMNTADRSIALMDTALRRRFSFIEMMPDSRVLRDLGADKVESDGQVLDVAAMLDEINGRIEYLYDREHTIGHAFFTGLKDDPSVERLSTIFRKSIIPLLQEYFYEDYGKIQLVLGDDGKTGENKKYQFIRDSDVKPMDLFYSVPEMESQEKKYEIQESAFDQIESYISIAKR